MNRFVKGLMAAVTLAAVEAARNTADLISIATQSRTEFKPCPELGTLLDL